MEESKKMHSTCKRYHCWNATKSITIVAPSVAEVKYHLADDFRNEKFYIDIATDQNPLPIKEDKYFII